MRCEYCNTMDPNCKVFYDMDKEKFYVFSNKSFYDVHLEDFGENREYIEDNICPFCNNKLEIYTRESI